jgi:hypothetical protein
MTQHVGPATIPDGVSNPRNSTVNTKQQRADSHLAQASLCVEVVVEHAGRARVREDVRVALLQVVVGEGPVVERAARVVVVDEGDGAAGPHAHKSWRAALQVVTQGQQ